MAVNEREAEKARCDKRFAQTRCEFAENSIEVAWDRGRFDIQFARHRKQARRHIEHARRHSERSGAWRHSPLTSNPSSSTAVSRSIHGNGVRRLKNFCYSLAFVTGASPRKAASTCCGSRNQRKIFFSLTGE